MPLVRVQSPEQSDEDDYEYEYDNEAGPSRPSLLGHSSAGESFAGGELQQGTQGPRRVCLCGMWGGGTVCVFGGGGLRGWLH